VTPPPAVPPYLPNLPPAEGHVTVRCRRCGAETDFITTATPYLLPFATWAGMTYRLEFEYQTPTGVEAARMKELWLPYHLGPVVAVRAHLHGVIDSA
jgi:hypothetical protein